MTKRAPGQFGRRALDHYPTPLSAVAPLIPHLKRYGVKTFVEPCCAEGQLIGHLEAAGFKCVGRGDINDSYNRDARSWSPEDFQGADTGITNPPWEPKTMMGIMQHQSHFVPSWFLIYSDWLFTRQSSNRMHHCTDVVPVGRVKWFPESKSVGYDNVCWVRMAVSQNKPTVFWPMELANGRH